MTKTLSILALTAALSMSMGAHACAWHAGGFGDGAFGMQWREYSDEELNALIEATYNRNKQADGESSPAQAKPRPTFASSAARAAQSAQSQRAKPESKAASSDDTKSE